MQRPGTSAPVGANSGRLNLAQLVEQIGDILREGEDSGTPSQHTELRTKLRGVLLRLLDLGTAPTSGNSKELAAVLQLLKLTLEKVPHWLAGDSNTLLLEILERLLPMLLRPLEGKAWADLVDAIGRIVFKIAETEPEQFVTLLKTLCDLFLDTYASSIVLSLDPTNSATVPCSIASIYIADSGHRPLELVLKSGPACEHILQAILKSLAEALTPRPSVSVLLIPDQVLHAVCCLLSCTSVALQSAALQFITAVLRSQPKVPQALHRLPDRLRAMLSSASSYLATCSDADVKEEWAWRLTALLQALADADAAAAPAVANNQAILQLGLVSASVIESEEQLVRLCLLIAEVLGAEPRLLESNLGALSMLRTCPVQARPKLIQSVRLYMSIFSQAQVSQAFETAVNGDSVAAGPSEAPARRALQEGSNKRRKKTPQKQIVPESEEQDQMDIDLEVPSGLAAVVRAVHALVTQLQISVQGEAVAPAMVPALEAFSDIIQGLASIVPAFAAQWALESVKKWPGWGPLRLGGRGIPPEHLCAGLKLLSSGLEAAVQCSEGNKAREMAIASCDGIAVALVACVRGEGAGASAALAVAVLASRLGVKDLQVTSSGKNEFVDIFDAARGKQGGTQAARAALLPAAACLAVVPTVIHSGSAGSKSKSKQSTPPSVNPFKGLLLRMAKSQDPAVLSSLIRSMHIVADHCEDMQTLVLHAVRAAFTGQYSSYQSGTSVSEPASSTAQNTTRSKERSLLQSSLCDWMRPVLDILCSTEVSPVLSKAKAGAELLDVVSVFLQHGPVSQVEQSKALAQWILAQAGSSDASVRASLLRHAALLANPQFLLTLHHDGAHPTHARDRRAAADRFEQDLILALKAQFSNPCTDVNRSEDLMQLVCHVGWLMRSSTARMLTLAILVLSMEQKEAELVAMAAECLRGIARSHKTTIKDLILATPKLVEHLGRQLPHKPDLLHELADLVGLSPRALALYVIPRAIPQLFAKGDRQALEALAAQAGISANRMLLEQGHHALAASLMHGSPGMEELIPLTEEMTGQDFILLARAILPRTVTEMVAQTGAAHEWSSGGASGGVQGGSAGSVAHGGGELPEEAVQRTSKMLALLASTTAGDGGETLKVNTSEFLAEGDHVTRMLKEFGDELERRLAAGAAAAAAASTGDKEKDSTADASSTHISADVAATLSVLRRILVLVRLTGPFVGRFLPQFMVLLGAAVRPTNHREIKLQGLVGWRLLVKALSTEAPVQLGGIVNQVVVTLLEGLQEGGPVGAAAARVVEELISACKTHYPEKIRSMPPLPQRMLELRHVNSLLQEARGNMTTQQHVELLLESLNDEALSVRSTALQELRALLASRREWLATSQSNHKLKMRLLGALMKAAEPGANSAASIAAQQACAECLGMLGAIDPSGVVLDPPAPPKRCATDAQLAVELLTGHLLRLLKTAPNLQTLDATTLAIQEVLRSHADSSELRQKYSAMKNLQNAAVQGNKRRPGKAGAQRGTTPQPDSNALFCVLPDEMQAIVRPYLDSKFSYRATGKKVQGVIFQAHAGLSFRRWLALWLTQLIDEYAPADQLLQAIKPVLRHDIPTAMFIAPYVVYNAVSSGDRPAKIAVSNEIMAVLKAEGSTRDGALCVQAVFTLLDVLQRWCEEAKSMNTASYVSSASTAEDHSTVSNNDGDAWGFVGFLLSSIPKQSVARAAAACGAHARALLHYETYLRARRGGNNPASCVPMPSYDDAEVSFLLEIYSKLEEPDGLDGFLKLRQAGPKPEDQRLAAEKAGSWGEALTLYERELAQQERVLMPPPPPAQAASSTGNTTSGLGSSTPEKQLSATRRGYLNCLLQMGHWQGLLTQVEGMGALLEGQQALVEAPRLAAMGAAAAWRLGRWPQLERYLTSAGGGFNVLNEDERWEARIGLLLRTAALSKGTSSALAAELEAARAEVMGPFSAAAMESYSRAYSQLVKLHMLQEVADSYATMGQGPKVRKRSLRWDDRLALTQYSLATQAPILALRRQLASLTGATEEAGQCWLELAKLCRSTGHYDAAVPAVLEATAAGVCGAIFERVQLLYARGEHHRAISELETLERQLAAGEGDAKALHSDAERAGYRARVVLRLAEWTAETGQGTREDVTGLFELALSLRDNWDTGLFKYAAYLDNLMLDARARQQEQTAGGPGTSKLDRLGGKSRIKLGEDKPHLSFLPEVIRNYGQSVRSGSRNIYRSLARLLTLWFEFGSAVAGKQVSADRASEDMVMNVMKNLAKSIPSHCWLVALPQLISRICHKNQEVSALTRHIVTQTTGVYPQQALWQLAAVSKSGVPARRAAANSIINNAKKQSKSEEERKVFSEHGPLCEQLIRLCNFVPTTSKRVLSAKKDLQINFLLRTMPLSIIIPTTSALTPALPPIGSHEAAADRGWKPFNDLVSIQDLKDEIEVMSSLQKPKKIVFVGSDGGEYCFLAKPKDDLRKDNRMMETAAVMNTIFTDESSARRRNLYLRRFAVVPITEDCGILEWVNNTTPVRYCIISAMENPNTDVKEMNFNVRTTYDKASKNGRSALQRWLEDTCKLYPAILHKFFLAKWSEPAAWLNARLNFTRTYAAWSMVGHIAGLGDRHGENVLIDTRSGDAVQIDFGCLFDKGLTLSIPEVVPFRLTQNIVDAFGVAGVEGVYRKSCEVTLGTMRKHRDTILSVMDTFVHDPLVEWSGKRGAYTGVNGEAENPQAKDAMATIDGRLKGTLLGVRSRPCMPLSVEGHVHRLVQEAMAKENLCQMYIWWASWQ